MSTTPDSPISCSCSQVSIRESSGGKPASAFRLLSHGREKLLNIREGSMTHLAHSPFTAAARSAGVVSEKRFPRNESPAPVRARRLMIS